MGLRKIILVGAIGAAQAFLAQGDQNAGANAAAPTGDAPKADDAAKAGDAPKAGEAAATSGDAAATAKAKAEAKPTGTEEKKDDKPAADEKKDEKPTKEKCEALAARLPEADKLADHKNTDTHDADVKLTGECLAQSDLGLAEASTKKLNAFNDKFGGNYYYMTIMILLIAVVLVAGVVVVMCCCCTADGSDGDDSI